MIFLGALMGPLGIDERRSYLRAIQLHHDDG